MGNVVVKDLDEAYELTLTNVLQFPCTLDDRDLNKIHQDILEELVRVGENHNIETTGLQERVMPIFQQAREKNKKRKFAFSTSESKTRGRYTFSIKENCEVITGLNNENVLEEIRSWLCDFHAFGTLEKMSEGLNRVKKELSVTSLMPEILTRCLSRGSVWEPGDIFNAAWHAVNYIQVQPIKVQFLFHEPSSVTGNPEFASRVITFTLGEKEIETNMPLISDNSTLKVIFDGELEYSVTKGVYVRKWHKILTYGLSAAFDTETKVTMGHRVTMRMTCKAIKIKMRDKIQINISRESVDNFKNKFQIYQSIETDKCKRERETLALKDTSEIVQSSLIKDKKYPSKETDAQKRDRERLAFQDAQVLVNCHEPWRTYVQAMREGGPKAFNEMILKKPLVIKDLPKNINNVAGIAFEELQIARVMAEAQQKNIPLKLYAGDGQGVFNFKGNKIQTPQYVDAVFHNTQNGNFYAVQFKFADDPGSLVEMMTTWKTKHTALIEKRADTNPNLPEMPEALHLSNVQVIGPKEVVDNLIEPGQFRRKIDLGFEHAPFEKKAVITFLENNKKALQKIVTDENIELFRKMKRDLLMEGDVLAKKHAKLMDAYAKLENDRQAQNIQREVLGKENEYRRLEARYLENKNIFENKNMSLQKHIKKEMTKSVVKTGIKKILSSAAVGVVTDGVISLIISGNTAIRKYCNNNMSGEQCALYIIKETLKGVLRGGVIGAAFCSPEVAGQLAVYAGYSTTGAVLSTVAKLAGPIFMAGMAGFSVYNICKQFNDGDITLTDAKRSACRLIMSTSLSTGGMILAGSLIGGPVGLAIGAAVTIAVAVGDHFLGDSIWSALIKDDPDERSALKERNEKKILENVIEAAYTFFDLSKYATDNELKDALRAALLKYHPDKGGDEDIFKAIFPAYSVIKVDREK